MLLELFYLQLFYLSNSPGRTHEYTGFTADQTVSLVGWTTSPALLNP